MVIWKTNKQKKQKQNNNSRLTLHPVGNKILSLFRRALGEPVVTQQHCDFIGVHELPGHEGQRAQRYLWGRTWEVRLEVAVRAVRPGCTHHDVVGQLVWEGLKTLVQGFVVIRHLLPADGKVLETSNPKSNFKGFLFNRLLALENTVHVGMLKGTIRWSRGSHCFKRIKLWLQCVTFIPRPEKELCHT